jgi:hypothetical protein
MAHPVPPSRSLKTPALIFVVQLLGGCNAHPIPIPQYPCGKPIAAFRSANQELACQRLRPLELQYGPMQRGVKQVSEQLHAGCAPFSERRGPGERGRLALAA